jgi:hypothetical protein
MKEVANHRHLVNLLGCTTLHDPICAILEFCTLGSLVTLVRRARDLQTDVTADRTSQCPTNYRATPIRLLILPIFRFLLGKFLMDW